jgi:hypothetical protein
MLIEEIRNIRSTKKDLRNFGLSVGIVLLFIGGLLLYYKKDAYPYLVILGVFLISSGLIVPSILTPFHKVWMTFATIMGWIMTRVILGIMFYAVFTPIGLIARLFGKRFLDVKIDKSKESYWHYRDAKDIEKRDYTKQF